MHHRHHSQERLVTAPARCPCRGGGGCTALGQTRRYGLETWWQAVMRIEKICEFTKHHCSMDLRLFLDVGSVRASRAARRATHDRHHRAATHRAIVLS